MKKAFKSLISIILTISMLICAAVPTFAADEEEYLCDLRIIYAEDYEEAKEILANTAFKDYKILKENLNEDTGEDGAWLAYKTTTDIEDAITDIAVMQMGGGYKEGNYQQMIQESYEEYVAMGEIYLEAIEYFIWAYEQDDFLAKSAYRQLNFYNVETQKDAGIEIPDFEGELLGDIFYDGIDEYELATMFFEGNSYALKNIRSLISMGVSYNEDGKTYLEKVNEAAQAMNKNANIYDNEDFDDLAQILALSISSVRDILNELADHEPNLNYSDDDFTDEEFHYIEIKAIADEMRDIKYRDEQSLYEFFLRYDYGKDGAKPLYPLIAALNDGQVAMTKVAHYYDVLRYSAAVVEEEAIEAQLVKMEEIYAENPFNIYTGVDRTIYNGTFALTTAADRADAYAEISLMDEFLGTNERATAVDVSIITATLGVLCLGIAVLTRLGDINRHNAMIDFYNAKVAAAGNKVAALSSTNGTNFSAYINDKYVDAYYSLNPDVTEIIDVNAVDFTDKLNYVKSFNATNGTTDSIITEASNQVVVKQNAITPVASTAPVSLATGLMFALSGALLLYSAYNILATVYHYYNPEYEDIPIAMVDLIETIDGDRYIKYDVVFEAEAREEGKYSAGDLNVFEGLRWNALYYTKSYEAGKPLLADEFVVSNRSNVPKANYAPVHGFGEQICFDLNKHNFDDDTSIYLSVKQSKNDKSAVADVPEIVGSMFGAGFWLLAGGIGMIAGIGGTLATQEIVNRKKAGSKAGDAAEEKDTDA